MAVITHYFTDNTMAVITNYITDNTMAVITYHKLHYR
jgi:hypothetical protein